MIEALMGILKNHYHLTGKVGGWIYRSDGSVICHGWVKFAELIQEKELLLPYHPFIHWDNADRFLNPQKEYEMVECSSCEGTGLFAKATWDTPPTSCDDCYGRGEVEQEVKS